MPAPSYRSASALFSLRNGRRGDSFPHHENGTTVDVARSHCRGGDTNDQAMHHRPRRRAPGRGGVGERGAGAADARDPALQVLATRRHGRAGHHGDVGEPRRGDAHGDICERFVHFGSTRARAEVRAHVHGIRDLHVLLRAASHDARDGGRAMSDTRKEIDMDVSRRGFMQCMAWAGTGVLWTMAGGVLSSCSLASQSSGASGTFSFAQISDTHVGFGGPANPNAMATLAESIARINALPTPPAFVLHTGDLSHGQKAGAFDTLNESLKALKTERVLFIPGEHDVFLDGGKEYLARYGSGTVGQGWRSFDYKGVHAIGLVNVLQYKADGLGNLGRE